MIWLTPRPTSADRTRAYRQRLLDDKEAIEARRRAYIERNGNNQVRLALPPTRVLVDWHVDEPGCRARVVGCD